MTPGGWVEARQAVLATNVFPSLLRRNRLMTVPVYDYVLMTEPLSDAQWAEIGWRDRQGIGDLANQFHYYRPTGADGRILFGGYDAVYHYGRRVDPRYENLARRGGGSRATSSRRSRNSKGCGSRTSGRGRSTRRRSSRRSSAPLAAAGWRMRRGSRGSASGRRALRAT